MPLKSVKNPLIHIDLNSETDQLIIIEDNSIIYNQEHRIEDEITAVLEGAELWTELKQYQHEMVVGPQGR